MRSSGEAGPEARSATDIPPRTHLGRLASANVRCALTTGRRAALTTDLRGALAMSCGALAMDRRAFAMSRVQVLRMLCCLA